MYSAVWKPKAVKQDVIRQAPAGGLTVAGEDQALSPCLNEESWASTHHLSMAQLYTHLRITATMAHCSHDLQDRLSACLASQGAVLVQEATVTSGRP